MMDGVARDILRQWFKVLKKDPSVNKPAAVTNAEEHLGEEIVNEIKESINNESN